MYQFKNMVTQNMIDDIEMGREISNAAIADYGLEFPWKEELFLEVVREYKNYEPFLEALDDALGNGEKITSLYKQYAKHPHKDVVFFTVWDSLGEEE